MNAYHRSVYYLAYSNIPHHTSLVCFFQEDDETEEDECGRPQNEELDDLDDDEDKLTIDFKTDEKNPSTDVNNDESKKTDQIQTRNNELNIDWTKD